MDLNGANGGSFGAVDTGSDGAVWRRHVHRVGRDRVIAWQYQSAGVHVWHAILDGIIDTARSRELQALDRAKMMKPDDSAYVYWFLTHQPQSTWSHELDLRPSSEGF